MVELEVGSSLLGVEGLLASALVLVEGLAAAVGWFPNISNRFSIRVERFLWTLGEKAPVDDGVVVLMSL